VSHDDIINISTRVAEMSLLNTWNRQCVFIKRNFSISLRCDASSMRKGQCRRARGKADKNYQDSELGCDVYVLPFLVIS